ncbi:Uncharacterized protein APZ42_019534 [Daphnia magna]|uniref:Uncharacterized protein n=1 Tax=Daphnia magna TaxID=35525 RepID=A0A164Y8W3_9CRUS|nr:Uncharacterized protein APZ42_019534 [Daphnia magna]
MYSTIETDRLFFLGVSVFLQHIEATQNTARWDPVKKGHETMVFAPDDQASDKSLGHSSSSNWEIPSADGILFDVCWNVTIGMERSLVVLQQYQPKFWVEALPNQPPASPPLGRLLMATRRALSVELANGRKKEKQEGGTSSQSRGRRSLAGQLFSIFQGKAGDSPGGSFH